MGTYWSDVGVHRDDRPVCLVQGSSHNTLSLCRAAHRSWKHLKNIVVTCFNRNIYTWRMSILYGLSYIFRFTEVVTDLMFPWFHVGMTSIHHLPDLPIHYMYHHLPIGMNQLPAINTKFTEFIPLVSLSLSEKCAFAQCHCADPVEIIMIFPIRNSHKFSDTLEKYTTGWFGTWILFLFVHVWGRIIPTG